MMLEQNHTDFPISRYLTQKAVAARRPLHGAFELTARCNFNCKMCYVHDLTEQKQLKCKELTVEQWLEIARQAKEKGMLFLLLTGGEAMLRDDFIQLYEKLCEMGLRITINSNGSLLSSEIIECFRRNPPARVNISLYGASEDTYRSLCGNPAYGKVTEAVKQLRSMGISVRITMTVTAYNYQDMESVYDFSCENECLCAVTSYLFPPIRLEQAVCGKNNGRLPAKQAGVYMVQRERMQMPEQMFEKRARYVLSTDQKQRKVYADQQQQSGVNCTAGRAFFWITWEGLMRPCGMFDRVQADVLQDGFDVCWEKICRQVDAIRLPVECSVCPDRELCKVCASMCLSETGAFDRKPEYVCEMVKGMKEEYARQLAEIQNNSDADKSSEMQ